MLHQPGLTILLIEADSSLRRLMTLGLQYRGVHVIGANSLSHLPSLEAQPSLVILDVDNEMSSNWSLLATLEAHPNLSTLPIIVLAWDCVLPEDLFQSFLHAKVTCLTKPFDARTLHTTIEELLVAATPQAQAQESLLAAQAATSAPSIWPFVTAVGLLLVIIGVMVQITLTGLGILIVIVALLYWTLGSRTEHPSMPVSIGSMR